MNCDRHLNNNHLDEKLEEISTSVWATAQQCQGNTLLLLSLLRSLELLHRQIREEIFQPSLPDTRQKLYPLLKEIEESGGWPYIERMKIEALLANFLGSETIIAESHNSPTESPDSSEKGDH